MLRKWIESFITRKTGEKLDSSGANVTCIYCIMGVKITTHETLQSGKSLYAFLFTFGFARVVVGKTENLFVAQ